MKNHRAAIRATKVAALLITAGLLGAGCIPIDITQTFKVGTFDVRIPGAPGMAIPDDFLGAPLAVCDYVPDLHNDIQQTIRDYGDQYGLGFLLNLIQLTEIDLVKLDITVPPDAGSFEGVTEIGALRNDELLLSATAGNEISPTGILVEPDPQLDLMEILDSCPTFQVKLKGQVPQHPPTKLNVVITVRIRGSINFM